ncbi:uncharacterized protein LOC133849070 [Drosophila sulfurigaster albostrigata]|uniref:uncharacterized protein LOC133849070 n=1 Tax=Drosophila sulfurigaster albostrigata TaxID=89887 RepID=UPI002D21DD48|nr:uncharacterized protein LOC133849070 [Drosophila sulfurigaster albostrigata]
MFKLTTCCLLLVALVAIAEASKKPTTPPCAGRCTRKDLAGRGTVCIRNARTNICTKLRACELRQRNCSLRDLGLPQLRQTSLARCGRVKGNTGSARCAAVRRRRTVRPTRGCAIANCRRQKPNSCWRTKSGRSEWISDCSARERNCRNKRRPDLQLARTADWVCRGPKKDKDIIVINKV